MDGAPVDAEGGPAAAPAQHSTPGAAAPTGENNRESLPEGLNIKFTPESQQGLHELEAMLHGPTGLSQLQSQEPLMQSQDCSLQQEMLQAEQNSTERDQSRAQQAAAALRGEAAAGNPAAGVPAGAEGGLGAEEAAATMAAIHAAAAAAAAGGSAQDADQLLKLAQAAQQLQQQQGIDPTTYAALQQQGLDWSGFATGMPMAMGAQAGMMNPGYYWPAQAFPQQQYQQKHTSLSKLEHANSNAKRRGPMDEMRQLQRILTKLLPGSIIYMPNQDGGGNKVQADDIKVYLAATLGQAPKPDWGLKNGWGQYLADLFNWATGREGDDRISREQAMSCARRPQGRSWEVVFDKLMELGVYSWNWELPLERQQVLNCRKTPPPELTRQQEALAAATAAAAAAAAVTAGATPDAIPSLPVVARMASLLGKRQHQPLPPMPALPMSAPAAVFHADTNGALEAGGSMGTASAGPSGAAPVDSEVEAGADERAPKQQRRSSAAPAAAAAVGSGGTSPVDAPSTSGQAAGQPLAAVSDADLVVPAPEVLAAASVQQLMSYIDNSLSGALQALQARVMSGNAVCPSMDYVMSMKNFKLDPLYASCIALIVQAANNQAAMEQQVAQQAALQQAAMKVKAEPGASSQPAGAPAPGPAPVASTAGTAASTGLAASSAGAGAADEDTAAAAGTSDAQGERDSDAALAAAAAAAGAAAAAAAMALSHGMAGAAPKAAGVPPAAKGRKSGKGRAAREPQPSLQHMVMQQSAVQAAALEAAAMAAAARQRQQKAGAGGGAPSAAAITADRLARLQACLAGAEGQLDSEDAAQAAAAALTALAGSQEQQLPGGMHMNYQHDAHKGARPGNSRLANGSSGRGAAAPASPMEAN